MGGFWQSLVGADPKSILCEYFKVGQCAKGFKCKFSHDLNVQRKGEKIDIYSDKRDQGSLPKIFSLFIYCICIGMHVLLIFPPLFGWILILCG